MSKVLCRYPSIDKPQKKYYRDSPVRNIRIEQTIYSLVFDTNKNNMNSVALGYLGVNWTFEKLKSETDKAAVAFYNSGLREGDVVLIGVSNCPEAIVTLLALNKIGVISKWFDVRASETDIKRYAIESNCRYLVAFDMLLSKASIIIDEANLEKVIVISPADSLSKIKQIAYSLKSRLSMPSDSRFISFRRFLADYDADINLANVEFDENRPSIMIQSSGTTGKPKVIVHSDRSATACVKSMAYTDLPLGSGKVLLNLLPPWIAYALGEAILYPLALGSKVILCPTFEPDAIMPYIGEFTISMAAPFHYRYLYEHYDELTVEKKRIIKESVDAFVSGGDKISIDENERFEKKFKTVLVNGYGNNEGWGCLTVNSVNHNRYGSVMNQGKTVS